LEKKNRQNSVFRSRKVVKKKTRSNESEKMIERSDLQTDTNKKTAEFKPQLLLEAFDACKRFSHQHCSRLKYFF